MEGLDFRAFDWDDTELIRAYNEGLEGKKANKENKKSSQSREKKKRKWRVGDYCRAIYSADKSYYEAKVISLNGDFCTVEFLGYGDTEDVDLLELEESEGKKARKKQMKSATTDSFDYNSSFDESEAGGEITDATVASYSSYRKKKHHANQAANNATFDTTMYETTIHQQYPAACYAPPPPPMPASIPFMAPPVTMPQYQMPPPPPMPQCPSLANNPSFSSMLSSWYMAGYYTGLHSAQKGNHGCQRCCSHSNQCCHN